MTDTEYLTIANAETAAAKALRAETEGTPEFFAAFQTLRAARKARAEAQRARGDVFAAPLTGPVGP